MFDALTELEHAIDKVAAEAGELDIARMCRLADRVEFLRLRTIGGYDRSGAWQSEGFLSPASAVREKTRLTRGQAWRAIDLARKLGALSDTSDALAAGEITRAHAEAIADACTPARAEMIQGVERELVNYAKLADPRALRGAVRRVTDAFDGDGGAAADEAEHEKNRVTLSTAGARGVLNGDLDPESTETVATALDAEIDALTLPDESRTMPSRRAEALTSIFRQYLDARERGDGPRRARTHVGVMIDIGALTGITEEFLAELRAEAAHVGRLSHATLERLTCDCKITRILMDGPSQVIDVGRATRTVGTALWNALVARDKGCTEPGCTRGPGHCQAHHIVHWSKGGPTDLDNLRLLCWEHHRKQHLRDALREKQSRADRRAPARAVVPMPDCAPDVTPAGRTPRRE